MKKILSHGSIMVYRTKCSCDCEFEYQSEDIIIDRFYVPYMSVICPECSKDLKPEERRIVTVSVENLIVDFFRDLYINSPIDGSKILFK